MKDNGLYLVNQNMDKRERKMNINQIKTHSFLFVVYFTLLTEKRKYIILMDPEQSHL